MISLIKNIHNADLVFSGETLPQDALSSTIQFWTEENFALFNQYLTEGKIECRTYDGSTLGLEAAFQFANYKYRRIKSEGTYPIIYDLVDPYYYTHPFQAIDYKKHLLSGVHLQQILAFDVPHFLVNTKYYHNFESVNEPGVLVLEVSNDYTLSNAFPFPSSNPVLYRDTLREYYNTDGTKNPLVKSKRKYYPDPTQYNSEGLRRRSNKEIKSATKLGAAIVYSGGAAGELDAQQKLIELTEFYSSEFTSWRKYGQGHIYAAIDEDTNFAWFDGIVADVQATQALIPEAIGMTVRNYMNDTLKGLL